MRCTLGQKSHEPCFHKEYMEAGLFCTKIVSYIWGMHHRCGVWSHGHLKSITDVVRPKKHTESLSEIWGHEYIRGIMIQIIRCSAPRRNHPRLHSRSTYEAIRMNTKSGLWDQYNVWPNNEAYGVDEAQRRCILGAILLAKFQCLLPSDFNEKVQFRRFLVYLQKTRSYSLRSSIYPLRREV